MMEKTELPPSDIGLVLGLLGSLVGVEEILDLGT